MFVVDTNVLLYAADESSPFHRRCRKLLESWRKQASAWYVTWGICYEFLRVATHPHPSCGGRTRRSPVAPHHMSELVQSALRAWFSAISFHRCRRSTNLTSCRMSRGGGGRAGESFLNRFEL